MKKTGYITKTDGDKVYVSVVRGSACGGNCVSCKGCPGGTQVIKCNGYKDAKVGDLVYLTSSGKEVVGGSAMGYGVPAMLAILGACLGYKIFGNDAYSILFMFLGLFLGVAAVKMISKSHKIKIKVTKAEEISS